MNFSIFVILFSLYLKCYFILDQFRIQKKQIYKIEIKTFQIIFSFTTFHFVSHAFQQKKKEVYFLLENKILNIRRKTKVSIIIGIVIFFLQNKIDNQKSSSIIFLSIKNQVSMCQLRHRINLNIEYQSSFKQYKNRR